MTSIAASLQRPGGRAPLTFVGMVVVLVTLTVGGATGGRAPATRGDSEDEQDVDVDNRFDSSDCYVVTIFGLKTADCSKQNSKTVPRSLDPDLQVMRFDENKLTLLADSEFSSYANLQEIYLARNRIELVSPMALRGLYSLQILDLDGNLLHAVPSAALRLVGESLRLLNLKGNPIRHIEADSLSGLVNIEEVNFENCWLNYVDAAAFHGLTRLTEINLVNNELQTLHPDMEDSFSATGLRVIRLYRNPWTCNCRLRWLRRWITSGSSTSASAGGSSDYSGSVHYGGDQSSVSGQINWDFASNTPTCAAPRLLRGVAWRHLKPDQFACPSRIVGLSGGAQLPMSTSNGNRSNSLSPLFSSASSVAAGAAAEIRVVSDRNATIECVAAGDPEPSISWSRDPDVPLPPGLSVTMRHRGGGGGSVIEDAAGVGGEPIVVGILTLVAVDDERDTGDYRCSADNPAGRAEVSFRLTVVDAGSSIVPSGRVSGTGNDSGGIRRMIPEKAKEVDGWSDVDRDVILGVIGGLLILVGVLALFVACRPKLRDCVRRQRTRLKRCHHSDKSAAYRNDCAASKPLNNVTSIAMTSLLPTSAHANSCNRRNYRGNNRVKSAALDADQRTNILDFRLSEPEDDDDGVDEADDGGQYDSASCSEEPLTRRSDSHPSTPTGTALEIANCSKPTISDFAARGGGQRSIGLLRIGNNDCESDIDLDASSTCSKRRPPAKGSNGCVIDDGSPSEQLSEASCDRINQVCDLTDTTVTGDVIGRHERADRSNRTVSFGPDLVLDADNSAMNNKWSKQIDDVNECDVKVHRRPNFVGSLTLSPPVSALRLSKLEVGSASASPMSAGEVSSISTSSSSNSTQSNVHSGHVTDLRQTSAPIGPTTSLFPSVTTGNHVGDARILPVGRPCLMWPKCEDARYRPLAAGLPASNRRHSGHNIDRQGSANNGLAFGPQLCPAAPASTLQRLSPSTCGGPTFPSSCSSLERPFVRRRLPQPRPFAAVDHRRNSHGNDHGGDTAPHQVPGGRHARMSTLPYSSTSTCLTSKNESVAATLSYTLADILAPPFGAVPVHVGARTSVGGAVCNKTETNRKYSLNADIDDDDSITTIL